MNASTKAGFRLDSYTVPNFTFKEPKDGNKSMSLSIDPSGIYYSGNSIYELTFLFNAIQESENSDTDDVISATMIGVFQFDEGTHSDAIPDFFYRNAVAILFPYLRSFISTLTLQACLKPPIIIPILNLSALEIPLRENTKIID